MRCLWVECMMNNFIVFVSGLFLTIFNSFSPRVPLKGDTKGVESISKKPKSAAFQLSDATYRYHDPLHTNVSRPGDYTILATGDVIPARSVNAKVLSLNNFTYPFRKTADFLQKGDIVFINLETPLLATCTPTLEGMRFCGDQKNIEGLLYGHVSVANIANNHAGNYGVDGIQSTVNLLRANTIQVTGNGEPAVYAIGDKKFGFLGLEKQ